MRALILACLFASPAAAQDQTIALQITFDPAALTELQTRGEGVVISAYYAGEPNANATMPPDEMGQIYIGAETITINAEDRTLTLGAGMGGSAMTMTDQPLVNINVYSARFTDDNNLLDCGFVDGPFVDFAGTTQTISCKLIGS